MAEDKSSALPLKAGASAPPFSPKADPPQAEVKEETDKEETRIYEVGYLIMPTIAEADVPREVTALKDILEREKAAVISEEFPKFRVLAYPMHKRKSGGYETHSNGYFGWVKFEAGAGSAKRIEETLKQNGNLLRFILVKTVRESTLFVPRPPRAERRERKEAPKGAPAPAPVSEAELEKAMEKIIAE